MIEIDYRSQKLVRNFEPLICYENDEITIITDAWTFDKQQLDVPV